MQRTPAARKYQAAVDKYSEGIKAAPREYRLRSNRALCYAALEDWSACQEDAVQVLQLKPDFVKGWFLFAKSIWKQGLPLAALKELETAMRILPDSPELLSLQSQISGDPLACQHGSGGLLPPVPPERASRNVSPCSMRSAPSRGPTPPPAHAGRAPPPESMFTASREASASPAPGRFRHARRDASPGYSYTPPCSRGETPPPVHRTSRSPGPQETTLPPIRKPTHSRGGTPPSARKPPIAPSAMLYGEGAAARDRHGTPPLDPRSVPRRRRHTRSPAPKREMPRNVSAAFAALGGDDSEGDQ